MSVHTPAAMSSVTVVSEVRLSRSTVKVLSSTFTKLLGVEFGRLRSMISNPVTASLKVIVTSMGESPVGSVVEEVTLTTVGDVVSPAGVAFLQDVATPAIAKTTASRMTSVQACKRAMQ